MVYTKQHAEFLTVTCLEWKNVLQADRFKDVITNSLTFLTDADRVSVYAFVIMPNHFHLIWQMMGDHKRDDVQRDFLKFTGQQILKILRNENSPMQQELLVNAKDRKYQVWERNSLGVALWTPEVFEQKLEYIHNNPVKAGLCRYPEDYKYSSALKAAQNKMTNLLRKYQEFTSDRDITKGVKRTSLQGKTLKERLVLGGNFNVVSTSPLALDLSPIIGYRFNTKFYAGLGGNFRYTFGDSLSYRQFVSPSNTSLRAFANYDLLKNFFAYAEIERAKVKMKSNETTGNEWVNNYFVGLGKKLLIHPKFYITFTALYNLNSQNINSSYASRFQLRVGVQTSDLAFRKKKIYYNP